MKNSNRAQVYHHQDYSKTAIQSRNPVPISKRLCLTLLTKNDQLPTTIVKDTTTKGMATISADILVTGLDEILGVVGKKVGGHVEVMRVVVALQYTLALPVMRGMFEDVGWTMSKYFRGR